MENNLQFVTHKRRKRYQQAYEKRRIIMVFISMYNLEWMLLISSFYIINDTDETIIVTYKQTSEDDDYYALKKTQSSSLN
jgi:hypothetical protein